MSHEIIKQPNGLFAVWSTIIDDFVMVDATPEDIINDEVEMAREKSTKEINEIVSALNTKGSFMHFRSWEEALEDLGNIHHCQDCNIDYPNCANCIGA